MPTVYLRIISILNEKSHGRIGGNSDLMALSVTHKLVSIATAYKEMEKP